VAALLTALEAHHLKEREQARAAARASELEAEKWCTAVTRSSELLRVAEARAEAAERAMEGLLEGHRRRTGEAAAIETLSMEQLEQLQSEAKGALLRFEARIARELVRQAQTEARYCHICHERPKDTTFNCGHTTCAACAEQVEVCPDCRGAITTKTRVYL